MNYVIQSSCRLSQHEEKNFRKQCQAQIKIFQKCEGFIKARLLKSAEKKPAMDCEFIFQSEWAHQDYAERASAAGSGYSTEVQGFYGTRHDSRSTWLEELIMRSLKAESDEQKMIIIKSQEQGLPKINIASIEGRLIEVLLKSIQANYGVELGSLGGYSASWIAKSLGEDGRLVCIEKEPLHAQITQNNLKNAQLSQRVEVLCGDALEIMKEREWGELDFVFIDADKHNYTHYLEFFIPLIKKGGLLIVDNAFLWGAMSLKELAQARNLEGKSPPYIVEKEVFEAMRSCWEIFSTHPNLCSVILPTADGLGVALKI
jgi:predicted O-methyltransferase YrrM/quinol monooxygenase YgiN